MTARGAGILGMIAFILLLAFGSYLLDVPIAVVLIATAFAVGVILLFGSKTRPPEAR
ncbi:MAG TPA: hypothetical protein VFV33_19005 [Gemmatimonadaceae bacterium]|nr:hypothetical protein [Gemmatimonadaceae bacterium]